MSVRAEDVVWASSQDLLGNKPFNTPPYVTGLAIANSAFEPTSRKGNALYIYDFGGIGEIGELQWSGTDFVSFRYKVADNRAGLASASFVGTEFYSFQGQTLDPAWLVEQNDLGVQQNNQLLLEGTVTLPKIFVQETRLSVNTTKEQPFAFITKMSIDRTKASGGISYLAVTDGLNTLEVQKVFQAVKNPAQKSGADYKAVNTNVQNQATVEVYRNGSIIAVESLDKVTDGIYEEIDFSDIRTTKVDTLINLKQYAFVTNLNSNALPYGISAEAIPFRVRSDYEPASLVFKQYINYDITRDIGFYRATVPILNREIDLYETKITSWNWNGKQWVLSDTDNVWKISLTLPPGTYRYNFWVDGKEVYDATNPETYYLDANNQKHLITGGYGYNGPPDLTGKIVFSEIVIEFTQTIEFVYSGFAKQVALIGTFNDYNPKRHLMVQQVDRQLIRRLADPNLIYTNVNADYNRIDIELPFATSITNIDFKTLIPRDSKQRVKIFLDDKTISSYDWSLVKAGATSETFTGSGTGTPDEPCLVYGYGYGSLVGLSESEDSMFFSYGSFYGYGYGVDIGYGYCGMVSRTGEPDSLTACRLTNICRGGSEPLFSYWDNNTDTITASEDDIVRWCLKPGLTRIVKKISFQSRVEVGNPMRQHVLLAIGTAETQTLSVSDYAFSDSYTEEQRVHSTTSDRLANWIFPTIDLKADHNQLTPTAYDANGNPIYGDSVVVAIADARPSAWSLNRSLWASNSAEIIYGVAGRLGNRPLAVLSAIDDRVLDQTPIAPIQERFVNLGVEFVTALNGIQVQPNIALWARMVGYVNTFEIRFYLTEQDANADQNALGPIVARAYGTMLPTDFTGPSSDQANFFELTTVVYQGLSVPLLVGNIIAVYQKGGRDRVFAIAQGT